MTTIKICPDLYQTKEQLNKIEGVTIDEAIEMIENGDGKYELLEGNNYIKPYFDIDLKDDIKKGKTLYTDELAKYQNKNELAKQILNNGINFISELLKISKDKIYVQEAIYKDKISNHLICDCQIKRFEFNNMVKDKLKNDNLYYIDLKVYGNDSQRFRIINSFDDKLTPKKSKLKPLKKLDTSEDWAKHFISIVSDDMEIIEYKRPEPIKEIQIIESPKVSNKISNSKCNNEEVLFLLSLINVVRAEDYEGWRNIGFVLHNIGEYFDIFKEFSKNCKGYEEGCCEKLWKSCKPNIFTLGTLKYWAKQDSPTEYLNYISSKYDYLDDSDENIANMATKYINNDLVFCDEKWFHFDDDTRKWSEYRKCNNVYSVLCPLAQISKHKLKVAEETLKQLNKNKKCKDDKEDEEEHDDGSALFQAKMQVRSLKSIVKKVTNANLKDAIFKELSDKTRLYDSNFEKKLNKNNDILGFDDCVYDLILGKERKAQAEDYITLSCGWKYSDVMATTEEEIKDFKEFLKEIFTEEEQLLYMLKFYASTLNGYCPQVVQFHTGSGGNGKGVMQSIHLQALGDYAATFKSSQLLGDNGDPEKPSPELANLKYKRFAIASEIKGIITKSKFTYIAGGTEIGCRKLNSNGDKYVPNFTMVIETNNKPTFDDSIDDSIERRLINVEFKSKFVKNKEDVNNKERIYLKNPDYQNPEFIRNKSRIWLKILLDTYKNLVITGECIEIQLPNIIKESTKKYYHESDPFINFLDENYERNEKSTDSFSIQTLKDSYINCSSYKNDPNKKYMNVKDCKISILKSPYLKYLHCKENSKLPDKHPEKKNENILIGFSEKVNY